MSAALAGTPVVVAAPATTPDRPSPPCSPAERPRSSAPAPGRCSAPNVPAPVITPRARDLNFTNEGGVCGTTRLLKNIGGLWLLQACRRSWAASGLRLPYETLLAGAADEPHAFHSLFDPDHRGFFQPPDMVDGDCRLLPADRPAGARLRRPPLPAPSSRASRSSTASCSSRSRSSPARAFERNPDRRRRIAQPPAEPVHRGCHRPHRGRRSGRGHGARQHRDADARDRRGVVARRSAHDHRAIVPGRAVRAGRRGSSGILTTHDFRNTWR